jgi:hypothetical protein
VRGLEVAQAAVLDVRDVAAGELELEQARVVRGAHEHGLLAQRGAPLARVEHALADLCRLSGLVEAQDQLGRAASGALGAQGLAVRALGLRRHGVGDVEQRLGGAVVALERDHRRAREVLGEGQDVLGRGRAKAVDGLQVVAHDGDVGALAAQAADEVDLQPVDVLVLVDEQVVDPALSCAPDHGVLRQGAPVEQQVVEVDDPEAALARAVVDEEPREVVGVALAPRERLGQQLAQRALGVDRARVDVQQGRLAREAPAGLPDAGLLAHDVQQVGRVAGIEHAEAGRQAEHRRVAAHEAVGDRVEGAAHHLPRVPALGGATEVGACAPEHLARGAPREGHEQHALGRRALVDEPRDARGQGRRLAGPGAREHKQRAAGMGRRGELLGVESVQVAGGGAGFEHAFATYAPHRTP